MQKFCLIFFISICLPVASHAAFKLTIDTTTKQLWISGSVTATGENYDGVNRSYFSWALGVEPSSGTGPTLTSALSTEDGPMYGAYLLIGSTSGAINIDIFLVYQGLTTITADSSVKFNYATLPDFHEGVLEQYAINGASLPLVNGSGASPITMEAVPEPSTYALLALGAGAVFWQIRRRRMA